jgi:hypothetical protein
VTTAAGPTARPAPPTGLVVGATSDRSVALSWTPSAGAIRYAIYEGARRVVSVAATNATVRGLHHAATHLFSVVAEDRYGSQSTAATVSASTATCHPAPPRPVVSVSAASPSTVTLAWELDTAATFYTVYDGPTAVATSLRPSAVVSGLPGGVRHRFSVVATLAGGCGSTSAAVSVRTPAGAAARATAPTTLEFAAGRPVDMYTASVTLTWAQPASEVPVVGYRLYEGGDLVGTTATTTITQLLPNAVPHRYTVAAVDAAGNESAQSPPLDFSVPYVPVP